MKSLDRNRVFNCLGWLLTAFVVLNGCSPQWHIQKARKHKEKAIEKGATFTADTIRVDGDTIYTSFIKNDTVFITETVKEYVYLDGEVRYITRKDKRAERRDDRKKERIERKDKKEQRKHDRKVEKIRARKSYWYVWLLIGLILGYLIPRLRKFFV